MIRVFVIEDHVLMRQSLRTFLGLQTDMEVCGEAESAELALREIPDATPDLLLVDISLPGMSGLALVAELNARGSRIPCLMLSGHRERRYVERALAVGARGFVLKGRSEDLPGAIRCVMDGGSFLSAELDFPHDD